MKYTDDFDQLKVKYIGEYHTLRFSKKKTYYATRDLTYGMIHVVDDFGEEDSFFPYEFEVVKVLKNGGLPEDDDSGNAV